MIDISQKSLSLAHYSISSWFGVIGAKLRLTTSKKINNPGFKVILPKRHHGDKFQKVAVRLSCGRLKNGLLKLYYPGLYYSDKLMRNQSRINPRKSLNTFTFWSSQFKSTSNSRYMSLNISYLHACMKFCSLKILDRLAYAYFLENLFQLKFIPLR